ncbi:MAG: UDP-N-acetylmuramoyl-L-alanine--D-glutamate ligase [Clostridia bacterium]|nr:UDP-N-acetylmuramoyl-L-alanine--D-glutamate ligase [Clostridia bacterium]
MQRNYKDFIDSLKNKTVMFCGLGKSNMPFLEILAKNGTNIIAYDGKSADKIDDTITKVLKSYENISYYLGDETAWELTPDILVRTPGMNFYSEKISNIRAKNVIVTSEMEIFFDYCPCPIIGVTGSDGKTTVTSIISEILKHDGKTVHVGGNIGKPLLPEIEGIHKNDIAVVELSSFQLMSMRKSPDHAVITNISPNHLDIHSDMDEYVNAKKQIFLHQNAFSNAILNYDNSETRKFADEVRGKVTFFSFSEKLKNGVWKDNDNNIVSSVNGKNEIIMSSGDIKIPGNHNIENYLAAIACVRDMVSKESIVKTAKEFEGVKHRIEFVKEVGGVKFYNDSIASTPTRTMSGALSVFDGKITLIAGGYDKKLTFTELASKINDKVSILVLLGNTSEKIKSEVLNSKNYDPGKLKIFTAKSMEEAVTTAYGNSPPGSVVVLSPACASFDLYKNFEERGNDFKNLVNKIK